MIKSKEDIMDSYNRMMEAFKTRSGIPAKYFDESLTNSGSEVNCKKK